MRRWTAAWILVGCAWFGCSIKDRAPARETVLPLLQQEAETLKKDGEQINPALGVKITWTIEAVEVREQPDNPSRPWAGTLKFKIESRMSEGTQVLPKKFEYVYDAPMKRWIMQ